MILRLRDFGTWIWVKKFVCSMGPRRNDFHLHGANPGRRSKVLFDHTETGDGGITLGGIDKDVIPPGVWMGVA